MNGRRMRSLLACVALLAAGCDQGVVARALADAAKPAADGPLADGPVTDGPMTDGPMTDGSMTDGPVTDGPAPRARTLRGVVTRQGVPVRGARIEVLSRGLATESGADGAFELVGVPTEGRLLASRDGDGDGTAELQALVEFSVQDSAPAPVLQVTLDGTGTASGYVTFQGQPAPLGTFVVVPGAVWASATDASGWYRIGPMPTGTYEIVAIVPGIGATARRTGVIVTAGGDTTGTDLAPTLEGTTGTLTGHARLADSADSSATEVSVLGTPVRGTTDADGAYTLSGIAPGAYALAFAHPGYRDVAAPNVVVTGGAGTAPDVLLLRQDATSIGPAVRIASPVGGTDLGTAFTLRAEASGPAPILAVELSIDGRTLVTDISDPYAVDVDPLAYFLGPHIVKAYAKDTTGAVATAELPVRFVAVCGNGIVQPPETCDAGPANSDAGACTLACQIARCGDGHVKAGAEACDDGNSVNGDGCDNNCTATRCGNGIVSAGEACDDGNLVNGDGCDSNCTATRCGNGIVSAGEACDDGNAVNGDGCDSNCTVTRCGNGIVSAGEVCDDGNLTNGDGCDFNCTLTRCGNGVVSPGEACDDGNSVNGDGCDTNCTAPRCGDRIINGSEECDNGSNLNGYSSCERNCRLARCGDGIANGNVGEECDDGNSVSGDGCDTNCKRTRCGNGVVTAGEQCDDGNYLNGDGCEYNCTLSRCGNGIVAGTEQCDDGNSIDGDRCDSNCTASRCGNGLRAPNEQCDDGNTVNGDGCDTNCTFSRCGNAVRGGSEQCDDGNRVNGDGCDNDCTFSICGNGVVAGTEQCDDGNSINGDGCDTNCRKSCGNGVVDPGETCDDGNGADGDGCDTNCRPTGCGNGTTALAEQCDDGNVTSGDGCDSSCSWTPCTVCTASTTLATTTNLPVFLQQTATDLYWSDVVGGQARIMRVAKSGGTPTQVATFPVMTIGRGAGQAYYAARFVLDDPNVIWAEPVGTAVRFMVQPPTGSAIEIARTSDWLGEFAVDGGQLYWATSTFSVPRGAPYIWRVPVGGGTPVIIATELQGGAAYTHGPVVVNGSVFYVVDWSVFVDLTPNPGTFSRSQEIKMAPTSGGPGSVLDPGGSNLAITLPGVTQAGLTTSQTSAGTTTLRVVPLAGNGPARLLTGLAGYQIIATAPGAIYVVQPIGGNAPVGFYKASTTGGAPVLVYDGSLGSIVAVNDLSTEQQWSARIAVDSDRVYFFVQQGLTYRLTYVSR